MNKQFKKNIILGLFAFLLICFFAPAETMAIGQISKPIIIKDALRGQEYKEEMVIFNTEKNDMTIGLSAEGDIKNWVKFYKLDDSENDVSEVDIKAGSNLKINAVIRIADGAPNGEYKGLLSATSKPNAAATSTESQVMLSQKIDRPVSITVSDKEVLKFDASIIPDNYDLAKGEPLVFRVIYDNQGNIDIKPQIQIKIKKDEQIIYNVIYPYPENMKAVMPNSREEIEPIIIQTIGYAKGNYLAELDFLINNETKLNKQFTFSSGIYSGGIKVLGVFKSINSGGFSSALGIAAILIIIWIAAALFAKRYVKLKNADNAKEDTLPIISYNFLRFKKIFQKFFR